MTSQPDPTPPTRAAIEQAKVNDDAIGLYFFQLVAAAVVGGVYFQSWFVGGGTFFALFACSYINGIKHIVAGVFVLAWAALGWEIGTLFDQEAARYVVGGVGLLLGLGINRAALQWIADMNQRR